MCVLHWCATEFYDGEHYKMMQILTKDEHEYYIDLAYKYPIISIEDAFAETIFIQLKLTESW